MHIGTFQIQIFVSIVIILGAVVVAVICDYLKGNNERLREMNIQLVKSQRDQREERRRRAQRAAELASTDIMVSFAAPSTAAQTTAAMPAPSRMIPQTRMIAMTQPLTQPMTHAQSISASQEKSDSTPAVIPDNVIPAGVIPVRQGRPLTAPRRAPAMEAIAVMERAAAMAAGRNADSSASRELISGKSPASEESTSGKSAKEWTTEFVVSPTGIRRAATAEAHAEAVVEAPATLELNAVASKPIESHAVESKPAESKAVTSKSVASKSATSKVVKSQSSTSRQKAHKAAASGTSASEPAVRIYSTPVQSTPVESSRVQSTPVESTPAQAAPAVARVAPAQRNWEVLLSRQVKTAATKAVPVPAYQVPVTVQIPAPTDAPVPAGFYDGYVLTRLVQSHKPVSGLVVSIGVTASEPQSGASDSRYGEIRDLIRSLLGPQDFACASAPDEFLLIFPKERGAAAQRRLAAIAQTLWDFQLKTLGEASILFNWGGVEVQGESITEAIASANERMQETQHGRSARATGNLRVAV